MIVKINGKALAMPHGQTSGAIIPDLRYDPALKAQRYVENVARFIIPASLAVGLMNAHPAFAMAAGAKKELSKSMTPLIDLIQDVSLPVGIIVATWGLIEVMLGNTAGRQKIKNAVISYVGVFVIPTLFYEVHSAFQGV